ncbi:uncharacterized protein LOC131521842 isoform X2 [Onychostoma macrolepis]|uniref:non-specific serine/threonine protein kinase n=1 Tax=Onychostoma macrolepis TaxID=369639 RepID=A0A7J6C6G1_9TELE|nr:uncharacterized protein LOC131521842 isoform X2 [Onychostoma macrolepis]KAF4102869.1 hypothetical protein G5714_015752 [Onychostoma macrolepis]
MVLFSRLKKALKVERAHEPRPCVPLKLPPIPAENPPHRLHETPAGADVMDEERQEKNKKRFWRYRLLHFFSQRGKYNVAKAEKVNQSEAGSFLTLSDEIHDHQEAPASEVLPAIEEQLEQDLLQPQDIHTSVSSTEDEAKEPDNSHIFWRYEFGHKLGKGGYSCVHAGTRYKDGLKVAVKIADKTPNMPYIRVVSSLHSLYYCFSFTVYFLLAWSSQTPALRDWPDTHGQ